MPPGRLVRWYADESVLGFGKLLARIRDDVVYPGHPDVPELAVGALDVDWMPVIAARGWIAFHRDGRIFAPLSRSTWPMSGISRMALASIGETGGMTGSSLT